MCGILCLAGLRDPRSVPEVWLCYALVANVLVGIFVWSGVHPLTTVSASLLLPQGFALGHLFKLSFFSREGVQNTVDGLFIACTEGNDLFDFLKTLQLADDFIVCRFEER